jgi:hypothetical protein
MSDLLRQNQALRRLVRAAERVACQLVILDNCAHVPKADLYALRDALAALAQPPESAKVALGSGALALCTVTYDQPKEFPTKVKIFVFGVGTGIVDRESLRVQGRCP